jgi:hypothetical protein
MRGMSAPTLAGKLVVAISSRALFDLTESHRVYTKLGVEATTATRSSTRTSCSRRVRHSRW